MITFYTKKNTPYIFTTVKNHIRDGLILNTIKATFFYNSAKDNIISDIRIYLFTDIGKKYIEMEYDIKHSRDEIEDDYLHDYYKLLNTIDNDYMKSKLKKIPQDYAKSDYIKAIPTNIFNFLNYLKSFKTRIESRTTNLDFKLGENEVNMKIPEVTHIGITRVYIYKFPQEYKKILSKMRDNWKMMSMKCIIL